MILSNDNTLLKHDYFAQMKTIDLLKLRFFIKTATCIFMKKFNY